MVMFCWDGRPTVSSRSLFSAGCAVFAVAGGNGEGPLCGIRNALVHEVRLASNVRALVLAVAGADGGVPSGTIGTGLNSEGLREKQSYMMLQDSPTRDHPNHRKRLMWFILVRLVSTFVAVKDGTGGGRSLVTCFARLAGFEDDTPSKLLFWS